MPRASIHEFEVGIGGLVPFGADDRDAYGVATAITIGYAPQIGSSDTRLILDASYVRSTGEEFQADPTFETDESKYTLYPISLGLRTNAVPRAARGPVAFYLGAALQLATTRREAPFSGTASAPTLGLGIEIRPELALSDRWGIWVRNRFSLLGEAQYDGRTSDVNYSGSQLQIGLRFRPD